MPAEGGAWYSAFDGEEGAPRSRAAGAAGASEDLEAEAGAGAFEEALAGAGAGAGAGRDEREPDAALTVTRGEIFPIVLAETPELDRSPTEL